ncbi:MAG: hypothetical protein J0H67_04890 [Rhodospirillales bacterium]|nr:hypothetical protein [Rhodospirillales bacterium]
MSAPRRLEDCPSVIYIVYTPGPEAEAKGYEPWLRSVDNPFFNAIPGVHHYANWKLERVLDGAPLPYDYLDFQGLVGHEDLERVWFNKDLDGFRTEWVRLWGYGTGKPAPIQANAYLMKPVQEPAGTPTPYARISGGTGATPTGHDLAWRFEETIRKHFSMGPAAGAWHVPISQDNPLGLDWLVLDYGEGVDALAEPTSPPGTTVSFVARLLAAP